MNLVICGRFGNGQKPVSGFVFGTCFHLKVKFGQKEKK